MSRQGENYLDAKDNPLSTLHDKVTDANNPRYRSDSGKNPVELELGKMSSTDSLPPFPNRSSSNTSEQQQLSSLLTNPNRPRKGPSGAYVKKHIVYT